MNTLAATEPLTNVWLAALWLPIAQIDPSHLLHWHGRLDPISRVHEALLPVTLRLGRQDLNAAPPARDLLAMPRQQFQQALLAFGWQLLAPGIRRVINGEQIRSIDSLLGESERRVLESDLQAGDSIQWDAVKQFGANAPRIVATAWLARRVRPASRSLWALLRLRLSTAVLHEAESDGSPRPWEPEPGEDPLQELGRFRDFALQVAHVETGKNSDEH
jgi:hypothetical protein